MAKKRQQRKFQFGLRILLVAVILIMINFLASKNFLRWDLTADKQYTISASTKEIIKDLDDLVNIQVYFSEKLPANLVPTSQYVQDLLTEYRSYAGGNITVEYIDPADDQEKINQAKSLGIPEVQMNVLEKDKFQVQNGFMGIALLYGDKSEVLPVVDQIAGLEYDLTSAITKLTSEQLKTIAFTSGNQEHGLQQLPYSDLETPVVTDYTLVKQVLEQLYQVKTVNLESEDLTEVDTLVIAGPKQPLSEIELYKIDQFIMAGGQVVFLIDAVDINSALQAQTLNLQLDEFLKNFGAQVKAELLLDVYNETASFRSGYTNYIVQYPFWVKLIKDNFALDNPVVNKLENIVLPWVSPLLLEIPAMVSSETIASSSVNSWVQSSSFNLDPTQTFMPVTGQTYPMVVINSGTFASYFASHSIPEGVAEASLEMKNESLPSARVLIIGDSDFISDTFVQRFSQNLVFFLNAIDYLTSDSSLFAIRTKSLADRPLKELSEAKKNLYKYGGILSMPVLVILYGLVRYWLRRRKRNRAY